MKRYIISSGQCVDEVNGVKIYDDGQFYIYTEPHGEGRMEFPTREEAVEYILDEGDDEIKVYEVRLLDKNDSVFFTTIKAKNLDEAKKEASKIKIEENFERVISVLEG